MEDLERDDKMIYCEILHPGNIENYATEHIATVEANEGGVLIVPENPCDANWVFAQSILSLSKNQF